MTAEDFVFWFSGYVSAIDSRVKVPNESDWEKIRAALVSVKPSGIYGMRCSTNEGDM